MTTETGRRERPRAFADDWSLPGTPRPPTTVASGLVGAPSIRERVGATAPVGGVDTRYAPDISPDGGEVAFAWDRGGVFEIYSAPLVSDRIIQLTSSGRPSIAPRWSPDGRVVAFLRGDGGGDVLALWVVDREGEHEREVAPGDPLHGTVTLSAEGEPRWSENTAPAVLSAARVAHVAGSPRWSPDGSTIAFTTGSRGRREIAFAHVRDGAVSRVEHLGTTPYDDTDPWWRPDGRAVLYLHHIGADVSVRRVFTVSHADDAVMDLPGVHRFPRVALDNETVVAVHTEPSGASELVLRPKGAARVTRITRSA